ncbi:SLBB domain-containing protein [Proteiniphilum sp. UBA5384]|uniref:SLBB domain-containing protein n=1 Tax=Proteiniphilum sp. UBA5384 TaxID=1947279 RepID=UPI0025FA4E12|nr:SLBB domain-containing protein [Proteiniphilum sp. UBA5384]
MHRESKFIGLLTLLFLLAGALSAQMSDQQVIQELKKYQNSNMSQEEILLDLNSKGVTISQLQRIRAQYEENQDTSDFDTMSDINSPRSVLRDSAEIPLVIPEADRLPQEDRIYGQNLFSARNLSFVPNTNMPTPANYVLGPGDEVIIDVWGNSELNLKYIITPDGYITVPGVGRIMLNSLNIQQAESKIRTQFSTIYSDLDSPTPGTFLAISVGNLRTIKVHVMGEVVAPGTYDLSSFSSAFHALYVARGPSQLGSLRNIRIFRGGRNVATVDLYEYLMKGNSIDDISLHDGDIVMVEPYSLLVQITGEIRRPMWYEMREDETLEDLLRFAGGFSGNAYRSNVSLQRKGSNEMEAFTLNQPEYATFNLKDGDQIIVGNVLEKFSNMVEITGAVERPGKYALGDRIKTVRDLVNIALGPTGDAYLQRALLYREREDLRQAIESFNLSALLDNRIADIPLRKNDRLHIPSIFSLEDSITVYIDGAVRHRGSYPFALNMRIEDVILQAGGLSQDASTARVDVYRRIKDPSSMTIPPTMSEVYTFTLQEGIIVSSDPTFTLQPFDEIVVRRSPGYEPQRNVTIEGEILFSGRYAKKTRNERISELVERAGGLTEYAYPKGARLLRKLTPDEIERTRRALKTRARMETESKLIDSLDLTEQYVGIDLDKAMKNPGGQDDIILREGDVLTIPQFNNTVNISGGVMYPNTVTFQKNMKLGGYIQQAGGYSRLAMKSKPFVIYANGQVATGRWARIEPGCEIVVPERPEKAPMSLQGILGISTSIVSIAVLISNLVK